MSNIGVFHKMSCVLGEGIFLASHSLLWLDINKSMLYKKDFEGGDYVGYKLPEQASAVLNNYNNIVLLASESGLCSFDFEKNKWEVLVSLPDNEKNEFRTNDGCEFLKNIYLFGTMQKQPKSLAGSLYLTDGVKLKKVYSHIGIPNSFIKINKSQLLISDSYERIIYKFTFNAKNKELVKNGVWLNLNAKSCTPDGGCIDKQGFIYIAMWDGYCIHKYDNNAHLIQTYSLPVPRPTNCILSEDQKVLYVTTAREGLSEKQLQKYPDSGSVYIIRLGKQL